jgi:hypothetical protein
MAHDLSDDERRDLVERCKEEVHSLVEEARAAGLPLADAVVLVADDRDPLGRKAVAACAELGHPVGGAEVYVVGLHRSIAIELLRRVAPAHVEDMLEEAPVDAARLLCVAFGGVRSTFVGIAAA